MGLAGPAAAGEEKRRRHAAGTVVRRCADGAFGGAQIYGEALPAADRFYLTRVQRAYEGDTRFPEWDAAEWRLVGSESFPCGERYEYPFTFETYERKR